MNPSVLFVTSIFVLLLKLAVPDDRGFTFNGFRHALLTLDGAATVTPEGLLRLTNASKSEKAHAFFLSPLRFVRSPPGKPPSSFSTTFVIAIVPELPLVGSHGMAFVLSSTKDLPLDSPGQNLGLFRADGDGAPSGNRVVAVEFDINSSNRLGDIDSNHVGINVNSIRSVKSSTAGYYVNGSRRAHRFRNLTLVSGDPMQAWVEYDGRTMQLDVTLAPLGIPKPEIPLLSASINLSRVLLRDPVYVGFSSSTGKAPTSHYVLGWSFQVNGEARPLDLSSLPSLPPRGSNATGSPPPHNLIKWLSIAASTLLFMVAVLGAVLVVVRKIRFAEVLEDWEVEYGPHRFSYKDLYKATKGFAERELLGCGGFGRVYKGALPSSSTQVAVKKISHDSRQGIREFIAEIVSIGRLRHRNLVQLLGYCRRRGELLLVYDQMPNGSLDKFLFDRSGSITLNWKQRFHVIKGVTSGLLYLHQGWEQVVIHRDIKASNVLLDGDFNGRLGDFGLARLYDHGSGLQTTHVVGTMGYLAPELVRTGKATEATDVFAYGAFLLEVVCGRRPIERQASGENFVLVDWVLEKWRRGNILEATDARLQGEEEGAVVEEVGMVMVLGLHCSHPLPTGRPCMWQVMQFLEGDAPLPDLPLDYMNPNFPEQPRQQQQQQVDRERSDDHLHMSYPSYTWTASLISGAR